MPLSNGTRLGPYEITGALGAGGMGEVYRATDTRLGRTVAVKVRVNRDRPTFLNPETGAKIRQRIVSMLGLNDAKNR